MKRKILLLALAFVLLVGSFGIVAYANNEEVNDEPYLDFYACSVVFSNTTYLRYRIVADNVSSANNVKLLVWKGAQEKYVYGTQDYCISPSTTYTHSNGNQYPQFYFENVATKQMTEDFYAVLYYEQDGQSYYSGRVLKYSILQYVYNKLGYTGSRTTDENFATLLENMLEFGASAQVYFGNYNIDRLANDDYYQVKVNDGYLDDKMNSGLYLENDVVTIHANPAPEGYVFNYWSDEKGNPVGYEPTIDVIVKSTPINVTKIFFILSNFKLQCKYTK